MSQAAHRRRFGDEPPPTVESVKQGDFNGITASTLEATEEEQVIMTSDSNERGPAMDKEVTSDIGPHTEDVRGEASGEDFGTGCPCVQSSRESDRKTEAGMKLHVAARKGHAECVARLLKEGASVGAVLQNGVTPLHEAAIGGHEECLAVLIAKGACVNATDHWGWTPCLKAAQHNRRGCISMLLRAGANPNSKEYTGGQSVLHLATIHGSAQAVSELIDHGAIVSSIDQQHRTPAHLAAAAGWIQCLQLLLDHGCPVDARDRFDRTPLHVAIEGGSSESAALLLQHGASPHAVDGNGSTPLHKAAQEGMEEIVLHLLDLKVRVDVTDLQGKAALCKAANDDVVWKMLRAADAREKSFSEGDKDINVKHVKQ